MVLCSWLGSPGAPPPMPVVNGVKGLRLQFSFAAIASSFAPIAKSNAKYTDLFALGDDLGFSLRSQRLVVVLAVIRPAHVQTNT